MKYKTSELSDQRLNQAVANANVEYAGVVSYADYCGMFEFGGPIIEREHIETVPEYTVDGKVFWRARKHDVFGAFLPGHVDVSLLVAAMRCFVFRSLGAEVEL